MLTHRHKTELAYIKIIFAVVETVVIEFDIYSKFIPKQSSTKGPCKCIYVGIKASEAAITQ